MKKSLIFAVTILILAAAGFIVSVSAVWGQKEQVVLTHTTLAGDMRAAKGISFSLKNQWSNRLFWDTSVTVDEEMVETSKDGAAHTIKSDTEFHTDWAYKGSQRFRYTVPVQEAVELYYVNGGMHWSTAYNEGIGAEYFAESFSEPFKDPIKAVADMTEAGAHRQQIISAADYMEYYPVIMNAYVKLGESSWGVTEESIGEYFGIKIPKEHEISVSVTKNEWDNIVEYRTEILKGGLNLITCSVSAEEDIYFAFYGKDDAQGIVDLDTKVGNGIYKITAQAKDDGTGNMYTSIDIDKEHFKVFSLPEKDCYPMELMMDEEGNLLLFTQEAEKLVVRVIETDSMQELQKLELMDFPKDMGFEKAYVYENSIFIVQRNGGISYIVKEAEGYKVLIQGNLGTAFNMPAHYDWNYAMDYKDGRLALIFTEDYYLCSAYVYVFSSEGLEYQGYFKHSADDMDRMHGLYDGISPIWEDSLEISF